MEAHKADPGTVRVAILSDTHGLLRREVVAELQDCTHILHAGDIIRETDLDELRLYGNIYAVRGNTDVWQPGLRDLAGLLRFSIGISWFFPDNRKEITNPWFTAIRCIKDFSVVLHLFQSLQLLVLHAAVCIQVITDGR